MQGFLTLLMIGAFGLALDAARRPQSQWAQADRKKSFWVALLLFLNLLALPFYLTMVLPKFNGTGTSSEFSKH